MDGDLIELLFALALITFGLLGSRKRKRPPAKPPERPPAPRPPRPRPRIEAASARPAPPSQTDPRDQLVRELERLLGGRGEAEPAEAVSLEPPDVEEAPATTVDSPKWAAGLGRPQESLETLEEAGAASHKRFHARHLDSPPVVAPGPEAPDTARLRQAIIWSEILGPPVALRE